MIFLKLNYIILIQNSGINIIFSSKKHLGINILLCKLKILLLKDNPQIIKKLLSLNV
jgi:hypothetical protein